MTTTVPAKRMENFFERSLAPTARHEKRKRLRPAKQKASAVLGFIEPSPGGSVMSGRNPNIEPPRMQEPITIATKLAPRAIWNQ